MKANELGLGENRRWLAVSAATGQNIGMLKDLTYNILANEPLEEKKESPGREIKIGHED